MLLRAMNAKESENITDAWEAVAGGSNHLHDTLDDALGRVGDEDAVGDGLGQADGAVSTVALYNVEANVTYVLHVIYDVHLICL